MPAYVISLGNSHIRCQMPIHLALRPVPSDKLSVGDDPPFSAQFYSLVPCRFLFDKYKVEHPVAVAMQPDEANHSKLFRHHGSSLGLAQLADYTWHVEVCTPTSTPSANALKTAVVSPCASLDQKAHQRQRTSRKPKRPPRSPSPSPSQLRRKSDLLVSAGRVPEQDFAPWGNTYLPQRQQCRRTE